MERNSSASSLQPVIIALLALLSLGPVLGSTLSFLGAFSTRWPALWHFTNSAVQWRIVFFCSGCAALASAWLLYKQKMVLALVAAIIFATLYIPIFHTVWGQRSVAMVLATVPALLIGYLVIKSHRREP